MTTPSMPHTTASSRWAWILGGALLLAALLVSGAIGNFNKAGDEIQVTGSARREVVADFVVWRLDVRANLPSQAEASREARAGATAVRQYLMAQGFGDSAITVRAPTTFQENEYVNGNATGRILGYNVTQQVEIRTTDVDKVAQLAGNTDALIGASRASVIASPPEYLVNGLAEIRGALTAEATKDAETRATEILAAVGARPGRLKAVRVGVIQVSRRNSIEVSDYGMYDTSDRNKEVTAVVRVTFAVK